MKNALLFAGFIMLLFSSCTTDFDVTTDWKDVTVVYGLLDKSDTAQYIKIEKAFLDPNTNALSIAKIPDSLYYDELNVELQQYKNHQLLNTISLEKVDGNLEGLVKDTGIFAQSPNILYKTKQALDPTSSYTLVVTEPDNGKQISSYTAIIDDFSILRPTVQIKVNLLPGPQFSPFRTEWLSAKDGKLYQLVVRFNYTEYSFTDPTVGTDKFVDWTIFTSMRSADTTGGQDMVADIPGDNFYTFLNSAIPSDPSLFRVAHDLDFLFSVGGETLDTYNQVLIAQAGLTSGQVLPVYTNIDNGLGLFSSRYHKSVIGVPMDARTVDSIACYSLTHHLNFERADGTFCP